MKINGLNKWIPASAGMTAMPASAGMTTKSGMTLFLIAILMFGAANLAAWSITDTYFGNRFDGFEARSFAMGGAGSFNDLRPFGIAANPANLTLADKRVGFQAAMLTNRNEDNRYLPLYNSFDNYVDDAVYASNINFFYDYAASGYGSLRFGLFKVGLGGYYKPLLSFDGNYLEEIRNNRNTDNDTYPEKIAVNQIENTGSLNQTAGVFSLGYDLGDDLQINLGAEYSLLSGEQSFSKTIRWTQWAKDTFAAAVASNPTRMLPDYTLSTDTELEGGMLKAGLAMRINQRFGLAASYAMKATLDRTGSVREQKDAHYNSTTASTVPALDAVTPIAEDYILPSEARIGFLYQPRNIMRTWFNLDVEYVMWSDVSDHFADQVNLYAGVEHWVENRLPLRLGFQAVNGYLREVESDGSLTAKRIISPKISAGSSFPLTSFLTADLGFAYTWREFEALDMFMDSYYNDKTYSGNSSYALWPNQYIALADRGWENPDKVRENNISLNAGLTFNW